MWGKFSRSYVILRVPPFYPLISNFTTNYFWVLARQIFLWNFFVFDSNVKQREKFQRNRDIVFSFSFILSKECLRFASQPFLIEVEELAIAFGKIRPILGYSRSLLHSVSKPEGTAGNRVRVRVLTGKTILLSRRGV